MQTCLLNYTPYPVHTVSYAVRAMHNVMPDKFEDFVKVVPYSDALTDFKNMVVDGLATPLEYVNTVWLLRGVSRAFQQQLTRHRLASYSIQSMRVMDAGKFCTGHRYTIPPGISSQTPEALDVFESTMQNIEQSYRRLIGMGISVEDARGLLPLNVHSDITMAINLRSLMDMMSKRMCDNVQDEFRTVVADMRNELDARMSGDIASCIHKPCLMHGKCMMPSAKCTKRKEYIDRWRSVYG